MTTLTVKINPKKFIYKDGVMSFSKQLHDRDIDVSIFLTPRMLRKIQLHLYPIIKQEIDKEVKIKINKLFKETRHGDLESLRQLIMRELE